MKSRKPLTNMSAKLDDKLQLDKSALSYAELHQEITKRVKDIPLKSIGNQQKQGNCRRESEEDELVKYMSNLPGYLERGESINEKVLNVGVLDWACLEQWQYSHKHVPHRSSRSSTSTSNASLCILTDGLTGHSSSGHSLSPFRQRIGNPSLQSYYMAYPMEGHSQVAKSSEKSYGNFQNIRGSHSNIDTQSQCIRANDHPSQNLPDSRLKACNTKDLNPKVDLKRVVLSNDQMYEATSGTKLEMSTQDGELEKRLETLRQPNMYTVEQDVLRKNKSPVLLPRDISRDSHSGVSDLQTSLGQKSENRSQMSFSEKSKELSLRDINYEIPHSCTLPCEVNYNHSRGKGSSSLDAEIIKVPPATFSASLSAKMGISPSRSRNVEMKQIRATSSSAKGPSQELTQKETSEKSRSSSPFRRLSFSTGFTSKGSGCKEDVLLPHRTSIGSVKSSSGNMRGSSSSDISGNYKSGDTGRSRSSPLRRLLDPLLRPKAANCRHYAESSPKDSLLLNKNRNGKSSSLQPEKELIRDHRVGCSTINTDESSKNEEHVSSTVQALLRIAVKNGLPLFTFAVDKDSNILAATVKKLGTSEKDECNCIYTFFTFREVKKKNGNWMKQASKCKGPDYIHHVVAQMKVSNSPLFDLTGQNFVDSPTAKEFVLYSVKLRHGNDQANDYQPNDELAAIILRIPKTISLVNDVHQSSSSDDNQDLVQATVVLPSAAHSHPRKGGPSSLIERWKSGGSCDCGGWDMGCELKILANENQAGKISSPSKAYFEDHFELFLQRNGRGREHQSAFSIVPFKHGIFSVVFDASLSLLQAFSICIALVDSKIPCQLSGSRNSIEGKTPRVQADGIKAFSKGENTPASYVS